MSQFLLSGLLIINSAFHAVQSTQDTNANLYDTYNPDCKRVRRAWTTLSDDDKQLYIDGLMELRSRGNLDPAIDEFIVIGSVHEDAYGGEDHFASNYLFWHGYMLWELESRIRNLGGRFSCFAMPYWQFSTGELASKIFDSHLGGEGDPNDYFKVNGFSWDYTTQQFWVPAHCDATGDVFPICSLKRSSFPIPNPSALELGHGITSNSDFDTFDRWYAHFVNLPHDFLIDDDYLRKPVVTQYDPIWYLFHSMVSYHQAIWTDCNDYDKIPIDELQNHPEAYKPFCDAPCGAQGLDDAFHYGGGLPNAEWSFINKNDLTVRKSYYLPQWNVIYDLGDGQQFYAESGLKEFCKGRLNPNWFMFSDPEAQAEAQYQDTDQEQELVGGNVPSRSGVQRLLSASELFLTAGCIVLLGGLGCIALQCKNAKVGREVARASYGSV